jgi:hypothetical protein
VLVAAANNKQALFAHSVSAFAKISVESFFHFAKVK